MTLKDIAREANISIMTVSNVINNKKNVSEATRKKVQNIISKYNYIPNSQARNLIMKSSKIILIVIPENINNKNGYYSTSMLANIEKNISLNNYNTMIYSKNDFDGIFRLIKSWNIDGVIFLSTNGTKEIIDLRKKAKIPIVVFDNAPISKDLIYVNVDDEKGGYLQTKFLIEAGHKKIAFVCNRKNSFVLNSRFNGYKKALSAYSIPLDESIVFDLGISFEDGLYLGNELIKKRIKAVVATADILALGIMEKYKENAFILPQDLSIIGYDDLELCQFASPKLSSISQNLGKKAKTAVDALIEMIASGKIERNSYYIDVKLINRQSILKI